MFFQQPTSTAVSHEEKTAKKVVQVQYNVNTNILPLQY